MTALFPQIHRTDWRIHSVNILQNIALRMLMIGLLCTGAHADSANEELRVKSTFLYKFCLYVEWPPDAFSTPEAPLVFGVAGSPEAASELRNLLRERKLNTRPFSVREVSVPADMEGVHLLYIAERAQTITLSPTQHTLVVTERPEGLNRGSVINFVLQDARVRFDIDLESAERRGLHLSAQLLRVARTIRGGAR